MSKRDLSPKPDLASGIQYNMVPEMIPVKQPLVSLPVANLVTPVQQLPPQVVVPDLANVNLPVVAPSDCFTILGFEVKKTYVYIILVIGSIALLYLLYKWYKTPEEENDEDEEFENFQRMKQQMMMQGRMPQGKVPRMTPQQMMQQQQLQQQMMQQQQLQQQMMQQQQQQVPEEDGDEIPIMNDNFDEQIDQTVQHV